MLIRDANTFEAAAIHALLAQAGWAHRIGTVEQFAALLANSQRTAVAESDGSIVGFARGITDGLSNGYLSMVVVAPPYRGKGTGRALVEHIIGDSPQVTWVLRAGREGAEAFFSKLGFAISTIAMERVRKVSPDTDEATPPLNH